MVRLWMPSTRLEENMSPEPIVIGTRGSDLALWQANETARLLDHPSKLEIIKTSGDRFLDIPLQGRVDKGFFTKEIEAQLIEGKIDVAVHSLKDLPTQQPPGLEIGAYLPRAPYSDLILVHPDWHDPEQLVPVREGCSVGATSLRRQALLKTFAPKVEASFLRGNVPSRIQKCKDLQYGAIILARAGVQRLGLDLDPLLVYEFDPTIWLPAPGQGAIAIQIREGDERVRGVVEAINHAETERAIQIERNLLAAYEGGCHTAFAALAREKDSSWAVRIGMETDDGRWEMAEFEDGYESCSAMQPDSIKSWAEIKTMPDSLCERISL